MAEEAKQPEPTPGAADNVQVPKPAFMLCTRSPVWAR